jgi:predicted RNA-binding protein YlxR (DUF448 family)
MNEEIVIAASEERAAHDVDTSVAGDTVPTATTMTGDNREGNTLMANTGKKQVKRPKHIPLRTCIACRDTKPKRELLRVVRTPDGHVVIDATGKKSGRGAYICARLSCWEVAIKKKRLEQEFEIAIPEEDRAQLDAFIATLPREETPVLPAQK